MKVAIASSDGESISEHFGRSDCFIIFHIESGQVTRTEICRGSFEPQHENCCETVLLSSGVERNYYPIIEALEGCQAVICRGMGSQAARELVRNGINPLVIQGDLSPEAAIKDYLAGTLKPARGFCRLSGRPQAGD